MSIRHVTRLEHAYSKLADKRRAAKLAARARRSVPWEDPRRRGWTGFVYCYSRPRRAFSRAPCSVAPHRLRAWGFFEFPF